MPKTRETHHYFCQPAWEGMSRELKLTKRERKILQYIIEDRGNREIANLLRISRSTVRTHLERVHRKLGVHSRTMLIVRLFDTHRVWLLGVNPPPDCPANIRLVPIK